MLHAYVQRFDVTGNLEKFCKILGTKQTLIFVVWPGGWMPNTGLFSYCFSIILRNKGRLLVIVSVLFI